MIYNWSFCILFGKAGMDHIHVNIYVCVYGGKGLINLSKFKHCDITQCINICNANSSEDDIPLNLLNLNQVDNYI